MIRRALATSFLTVCLLFVLAPVAAAGLLDDTTDTVEGIVGGGDGGSTDDSSSGGGGSSDSSDPIGDLVGGITAPVTGGDPEKDDPVKKVKDTVDETVGGTEKELEEATSDPSGYVGGITNTVDDSLDDAKKTLGGGNKKKSAKGKKDGGAVTAPKDSWSVPEVAALHYAALHRGDGATKTIELLAASREPAPVAESVGGVLAQIGRIAIEAAEGVAFPLALALMVGGFLMVQNRIDRRDPKLALAPIDSDNELLTFS